MINYLLEIKNTNIITMGDFRLERKFFKITILRKKYIIVLEIE